MSEKLCCPCLVSVNEGGRNFCFLTLCSRRQHIEFAERRLKSESTLRLRFSYKLTSHELISLMGKRGKKGELSNLEALFPKLPSPSLTRLLKAISLSDWLTPWNSSPCWINCILGQSNEHIWSGSFRTRKAHVWTRIHLTSLPTPLSEPLRKSIIVELGGLHCWITEILRPHTG